MRNDARPIGEDSPASPVGGEHERQSHVVNKQAEEQPRDAKTENPKTAGTRKPRTQG